MEGTIYWQWKWYQVRISSEAAAVAIRKVDINKFHYAKGYANEQVARATAHQLGTALRGNFVEHRENCAINKIKKKNSPKASANKLR